MNKHIQLVFTGILLTLLIARDVVSDSHYQERRRVPPQTGYLLVEIESERFEDKTIVNNERYVRKGDIPSEMRPEVSNGASPAARDLSKQDNETEGNNNYTPPDYADSHNLDESDGLSTGNLLKTNQPLFLEVKLTQIVFYKSN